MTSQADRLQESCFVLYQCQSFYRRAKDARQVFGNGSQDTATVVPLGSTPRPQ